MGSVNSDCDFNVKPYATSAIIMMVLFTAIVLKDYASFNKIVRIDCPAEVEDHLNIHRIG